MVHPVSSMDGHASAASSVGTLKRRGIAEARPTPSARAGQKLRLRRVRLAVPNPPGMLDATMKGQAMLYDRLYYELRLMGKAVLVVPVCILVFSLGLAGILRMSEIKMVALFSASLEMFLPLAAGVFVAMQCGYDTALELQLTLPTSYRRTALVRMGLIGGWTGLIALISSVFIYSFHLAKILPYAWEWPALLQWLSGQLLWLAPLLWFVAVGLCLALLLRSRVASSALLGGIWVTENIMYGLLIGTNWLHPVFLFATTLTPVTTLASFWAANRAELSGTALVLLVVGWFQLRNSEALLQRRGEGE